MPHHSRLSALRRNPTTSNAKSLRSTLTDSEQRLWYHLRDRRLLGFKFRRQVPIGRFIVDFLCEEARLIVEADGGQHDECRDRDAERSQWLESRGYRVVRYWNCDVMDNIEGVLEDLLGALKEKTEPSPPTPLPRERGETSN